jgi:hypothetical protein
MPRRFGWRSGSISIRDVYEGLDASDEIATIWGSAVRILDESEPFHEWCSGLDAEWLDEYC